MSQITRFFQKEFKGLLGFAFRRFIVDLRNFLNFKKFYEIEENPKYDKNTTSILKNIYKDLNIINHNASWNSFKERENNFKKSKKIINKYTKKIKKNLINQKTVRSELNNDGFLKLGKKINISKCKNIIKNLKNKKVYNAHHVLFSTSKKEDFYTIKQKYINACYDYKDIFSIPDLTKIIINEENIKKIYNYFGCVPTVNTILLSWTFDKFNYDYGTQIFHRDVDDYRQCNLFTILTDTKDGNGGHEVYKRTQNFKYVKKVFENKKYLSKKYKFLNPSLFFNMPIGKTTGYGNNEIYSDYFNQDKVKLCGAPGSSFLTDAYALHRGVPPKKRARLMLWTSYTLLSEASSSYRNFLAMQKKSTNSKRILKRVKYNCISNVVKITDLIKYSFRNIIDFNNDK